MRFYMGCIQLQKRRLLLYYDTTKFSYGRLYANVAYALKMRKSAKIKLQRKLQDFQQAMHI
jgi:hypothetical protein